MAKKQKETVKSYFKELGRKLMNPRVVSIIVIAIWLIQLIIAEDWLNIKVGNFSGFGSLIAIGVFIIVLFWLRYIKIFTFYHFREVTPFDVLLWGLFIVFVISYGIFVWRKSTWQWLFLLLTFSSLVSLIIRLLLVKAKLRKNISPGQKLVDLKDLAKRPISWEVSQGAIIIDEHAVGYDLFERNNTINELYNAIVHYSSEHSYNIGLIGKWGTGKTTILNIVREKAKKQNNGQLYFVQTSERRDFDLWLFGSKEELIKGFYDTLLFALGIKYNSVIRDELLQSVSEIVAGVPHIGRVFSPLISHIDSYQNVIKLKKQLSTYILDTSKHYVMCIENLDRADDEQIILLLKLLNSIFDLPNVTYVLLYDKDRLKEIFHKEDKVNASFADKVINQEVKMPNIIDGNICRKIYKNILRSYKISSSEISEFDFVIDYIVANLRSVRELKRIINSVFNILALQLRLNLPQVISIQYIGFVEPRLYEKIKENKSMFILNNLYDLETKPLHLNDDTEAFFKKLKTEYGKYMDLLGNLFPKVRVFNQGNKNNVIRPEEPKEEMKKLSICIGRYFDNYFLLYENDYVVINQRIRKFINEINYKDNVEKQWQDLLEYGQTAQVVLELGLFTTIQDIPNLKVREELSESMFVTVTGNKFKDKFPDVDRDRIVLYIVDLIGENDKTNFTKFEKLLSGKYRAVDIISKIHYYMNHRLGAMSDAFVKNQKRMNRFYNSFCKDILNKRINLYDDKYYEPKKICSLFNYFQDEKNGVQLIAAYLNSILSENNIYRFLFDMMSESRDIHGWSYQFPEKGFNFDILNAVTKTNVLIRNSAPQNKLQVFIFHEFNQFLENKKDNVMYFDKPFNTKLL